MYSAEKITGVVIKQWFIDAYINLQKHRQLLERVQDPLDDLKDCNTCSNVLKHVVEALDDLADDADCTLVMFVATEEARKHLVGTTTVEFYQYMLLACKYIKPQMSPADLVELIDSVASVAKSELVIPESVGIGDIFIKASNYCQYLDSPLSVELVLQCLIASAQELLVESGNYLSDIPDVKIAIACIVFSSALQAWKECSLAENYSCADSDVITQMLADMVAQAKNFKHGDKADIFEVSYQLETSEENIQKLKKKVAKTAIGGVFAGQADIFGLGTWTVVLKTSTPLSVLPMGLAFKQLSMRVLKPLQLQSYAQIQTSVHQPEIRLFEATKNDSYTQDTQVNVIACTASLSLTQPLARSNAQVVRDDISTDTLLSIVEGISDGYVVLLPTNSQSYQTMCKVGQLSQRREKIVIAETKNDLEVKYLCEQIATTPTVLAEAVFEKQALENYISKQLDRIRSIHIDSQDDNLEQLVSELIFPDTKHVIFLLNDKEAIFLQDRLEQLAYQKNPLIQVEMLVSNNDGLTVLVQE